MLALRRPRTSGSHRQRAAGARGHAARARQLRRDGLYRLSQPGARQQPDRYGNRQKIDNLPALRLERLPLLRGAHGLQGARRTGRRLGAARLLRIAPGYGAATVPGWARRPGRVRRGRNQCRRQSLGFRRAPLAEPGRTHQRPGRLFHPRRRHCRPDGARPARRRVDEQAASRRHLARLAGAGRHTRNPDPGRGAARRSRRRGAGL
ncbi:hypothetical protein D3C86_1544490 [compost metagenome]